MINESEACTILKNSFIQKGAFSSKIPDASNEFAKTVARPFDMFCVSEYGFYFIEVKYMSSLKSFDLQRIETHQIENLCQIKALNGFANCWIVLAVKAGRGDNRFYFFKDIREIKKRRDEKRNYLKKELENLPYYKVHKNLIDINEIKITN